MKYMMCALLVAILGAGLSGCYTKACDYPMDYKAEMMKGKMR